MADSPVFLVGLPRTGKTPLRMALGAHPGLSMTRKSRMWTTFHGNYGDLADPVALESCLDAMLADPGVARLLPDANAIRHEFASRNQTYADLFGVFHAQYARRFGKPRWGEQMAFLEQFAEPIFDTWPEARMIHMVRLPGEWIPGAAQRKPGGVGSELTHWTTSAQLAVSNRAHHASRYLIVQYEELMADPTAILKAVGAFINEDVNQGMVDVLTGALPDPTSTGLGPAARRFIDDRSRSLLAALDYPSPPIARPQKLANLWFNLSPT